MQRIKALHPETTTGRSKELFEAVQAKLGVVPNMMRTMGNSPAVLGGYLQFSEELAKGTLGSKTGELIAVAVANANGCNYCNAAHSFIADKLVGIAPEVIDAAREGRSANPQVQAALTFSGTLLEKKGKVSESDIETLKSSGYDDAAVAEIIAHTAINIFTNYFNNALAVEVDFPEVALVG